MTTSILLAHPHMIYRHGLREVLRKDSSLNIVAEADNAPEALRLAAEHHPDVAILDLGLPGLDITQLTAEVHRQTPGTRVIVLSLDGERWRIAATLRAGATGALPTECEPDELLRAVESVVAGRMYLSPGIADIVVEQYVRPGPGNGTRLSARQREVLQLMADGHSSKEIATQLRISSKTVDTHRLELMEKLKLYSVAQLTKYAVREGMTTLDV